MLLQQPSHIKKSSRFMHLSVAAASKNGCVCYNLPFLYTLLNGGIVLQYRVIWATCSLLAFFERDSLYTFSLSRLLLLLPTTLSTLNQLKSS